ETRGRALFGTCRAGAIRVLGAAKPYLDFPATGMVLFALGAWSLLHEPSPPEEPVRLLAIADRFAYNRSVPSMRWDRAAAAAEQVAPGLIGELRAGYAERPPPGLLAEARRTVELLHG